MEAEQARCARCGTALGPRQLDCPSCHTLVHSAALKTLAAEAEAHQSGGREAEALGAWKRVLELLPPESQQHAQVQERVSALETKAPIAARKPKLEDDAPGRIVAGVAAVGLALWKLKAFVPMAATMLLSFGAYWTAYGWRFAAGLVMSIWIHEMGHVLELKRLGLRASLPMFIPGVGAVVRLQQRVPDAHTDAKIGLAGPLFGALAALGCLCVRVLGGGELWLGLAQAGALINLFNLTPLWQLDGGRAFNALSPGQRALCTLAIGAALGLSGQMLLALPLIGAVLRLVGSHAPREGDLGACVTFLGLVAGLTAVASLRF